jgi:hypothetical protein
MAQKKEDEYLTSAKTLADAVSTQAQVANKAWFAMMTVALFAILPREVILSNTVKLPFGLDSVPVSSFYLVVYPLLVILVIAFSSAHAQQITAQNDAQDILNLLAREHGNEIPPRTWFDMWRKPSLNRVGPLPMSLKHVFPKRMNHTLRKVVMKLYYAVLKIVALAIYLVFPFYALWHVYSSKLGLGATLNVYLVGALLATVTLFQILFLEIRYAWRAGKHI